MNESVSVIGSVEILPLESTEINPLLTKVRVKVLHLGENRNRSFIDKNTAREMAKTLRGNPIVARYREDKKDFTDHGEEIVINDRGITKKVMTKPYGFIDLNAEVWFEDFIDTDERGNQIQHTYLVTEGMIWNALYEELQDTIVNDGGRPQSMELDEKSLKGNWSNQINPNYEIFIINDAIITKLCALGEDTEPCFLGASITPIFTEYSDESFVKELIELKHKFKFALQNNKGGQPMHNEIQDEIVETPVAQFEDAGVGEGGESSDSQTSTGEEGSNSSEGSGEVTPPASEGTEVTPPAAEEGDNNESDSTVVDGVTLTETDEAILETLEEDYAPEGETVAEALVKDGATNIPKSIIQNTKTKKDDKDEDESDETDSENSEDNTEETEEEDDKKKKKFALEQELEELQIQFAALKVENEKLLAFKQEVENKEKDELIASFYMLSDEDKKDVIANKANYSLRDIKAELSMICVDKKINFSADEAESSEPITYNLNAVQASTMPAWLAAVKEVHDARMK